MVREVLQRDLSLLLRTFFKKSLGEISLEHPNVEDFGDFSTNLALRDFGALKEASKVEVKSPLELACKIAALIERARLSDQGFGYLSLVKVEPPGFINFYLSDTWLSGQLAQILAEGSSYGGPVKEVAQERSQIKYQVEYVSANPTGPLHIGNLRGGPVGDALANVLAKAGYSVWREYYHNDVGGQVKKLGESVLYWYKKHWDEPVSFPEDGYQGAYVQDLAEGLVSREGRRYLGFDSDKAATAFGKEAVAFFLKEALDFCQRLGINFDRVIKESEVVSKGRTKEALSTLQKAGKLKEAGGAWWFAPADSYLKDRECVVIKSNGEYTYFSNDIGYHWDKFAQGFRVVIDVWGANHHGHVPRMRAAMAALGVDPERLKVVLYQWVRVRRGEQVVSMSKRKGSFILAKEVLDEIGSDALRFSFLLKDAQTPLDFDLELVKKETEENPVYYVQYAHARMSSLLSRCPSSLEDILQVESFAHLNKPSELRLIRHLLKYPELIEDISRSYAVHQLTTYAISLADLFHQFYEECRVLGSGYLLERERLALVMAARKVLQDNLGLIGVSTPERM